MKIKRSFSWFLLPVMTLVFVACVVGGLAATGAASADQDEARAHEGERRQCASEDDTRDLDASPVASQLV